MKVYSVHLRAGAHTPDRDAVLVKEGFSWPAFFFGPLWALYHRMWFTALGLFALSVLIGVAKSILQPDPLTDTAITLGVMTLIGGGGNDWLRTALAARGWRQEGLTAAPDRDAALRRYFDLHPDAAGGGAAAA